MKKLFFAAVLSASAYYAQSQISGIPVEPPAPQAVPAAKGTEKSATPQPTPVSVPSNPVPPVYPGAEPTPVVLPRDLVYPASAPAPTTPAQREPIKPIDATNNLQPTQPQRDEASRKSVINDRPDARIYDARVSKNESKAATTVEGKTATAQRPEDRPPLPPTKKRTTVKKTNQQNNLP